MQCPVCGNRKNVAVDLHADGYAKEIMECCECATVWLERGAEIIFQGRKAA